MSQASKILDKTLAPLSRKFPELISEESLTNVHPFSKKFVFRKNPKLAVGRKISSFQQEPGKIDPRSGHFICSKRVRDTILEGSSAKGSSRTGDNAQKSGIVNRSEIMEMMGKGAIKKLEHQFPDQFLSNILLVKKKDGGNHPCINLKALNKFIPCKHFEMEDLHCLKNLLKESDFLCKIDLKDVYFSVPLCMSSRKCVRFGWLVNLYEFLCLCFGLGPAPRLFPKLLKVPIALLRRLNICLVIYLDGILLMGRTEEILMSRNTLIFLLQHLGFLINLKKSVLTPSQQIESLGPTIDTYTMTVALTEEKMEKAILKFLLSHLQTTLLELTTDVLNCPSSSASSSTPKVFKTTTNTITKPGLFIPGRDIIKQLVKTGTSLMGEKQWKIKMEWKMKEWKITKTKGTQFRDTNMHQNQVR